MILGCIIIGIVLAYFLVERQKEADRQQHFQQSDYFAQTGNAYYDVKTNAGKRGEYFISELINPLIGRVFTNEMIDQIYEKLYPLTQVSEMQKMEHVNQVCRKKS